MFKKIAFLPGVLIAVTSPAVLGQSYTFDQTAPYEPRTYRLEAAYGVGNIDFNNTTGSGIDPYGVTPDFKVTRVTFPDSTEMEVLDICAQMFVGPTGASSYSIRSGFLHLLSPEQAQAAELLLSNTLDDFIFARSDLSGEDPNVVGAAIQIAFWEIAEDGFMLPSLDDKSAIADDLSIIGFAGGYSGNTAEAILLAESYLKNIRDAAWEIQDGYGYFYADAVGEQDRMWITYDLAVIPEPSTTLLGLLTFGLLMRRRRCHPPSGRLQTEPIA